MLTNIARCPEMLTCLRNPQLDHPCRKIVLWQSGKHGMSGAEHQVPEPWNGKITEAPLLFLSSNPSFSSTEHYPTVRWSDRDLTDFFENRFSKWMKDGTRFLQKDGSYSRKTRFNADVQRYARA